MTYVRKDPWYHKAKREGYRSRAAYKLEQIAAAEKLLKGGDLVVDAGAAPGGWSQLLARLVGPKGRVIAVDLLRMEPLPDPNVTFWQRDLSDGSLPGEVEAAFGRKADAVLSDAAPNTTGSAFTDQARSADLVRTILLFARAALRPGGTFLAKVFAGPDADDLFREMQPLFGKVKRIRPDATRKESFEIYLLGRDFRG
jgi:23S rRNA (uridine2552-2'-O)-methyltransferase